MRFDKSFIEYVTGLVNKHPVLWNNYYMWGPTKPALCKIYKHGINFNIVTDYQKILQQAVTASISHSQKFMEELGPQVLRPYSQEL